MIAETLQRQYITDADGHKIGVILPIQEWEKVREALDMPAKETHSQVREITQAANDPLFMEDLRETMEAFETTDSEWWERES